MIPSVHPSPVIHARACFRSAAVFRSCGFRTGLSHGRSAHHAYGDELLTHIHAGAPLHSCGYPRLVPFCREKRSAPMPRSSYSGLRSHRGFLHADPASFDSELTPVTQPDDLLTTTAFLSRIFIRVGDRPLVIRCFGLQCGSLCLPTLPGMGCWGRSRWEAVTPFLRAPDSAAAVTASAPSVARARRTWLRETSVG